MLTATQLLAERAEAVQGDLNQLLDRSSLTDFGHQLDGVIYVGPTGSWGELDIEGKRLQSRALEVYQRFHATLVVLLRGLPQDALKTLKEADRKLRELIEQRPTYSSSVAQARETGHQAIQQLVGLIEHLDDPNPGLDIYAPDTNALLHNPDLENWKFAESQEFELTLLPSVVGELDELKATYRNDAVRQKAEGLVSRIKGYRARGSLSSGVPLCKPTSTIRAVATEPNMTDSLPWLDASNRDDRFIASAIELIRQRPRSLVTIVTRDINLQNKTEFASLPFFKPPDPT